MRQRDRRREEGKLAAYEGGEALGVWQRLHRRVLAVSSVSGTSFAPCCAPP